MEAPTLPRDPLDTPMDYPTLPIGFQTGHPLEGPGIYTPYVHTVNMEDPKPCQTAASGFSSSKGHVSTTSLGPQDAGAGALFRVEIERHTNTAMICHRVAQSFQPSTIN